MFPVWILLALESINFSCVMSPYEFDKIWTGWLADARTSHADSAAIAAIDSEVRQVQLDWRAAWAVHGDAPEGWPVFVDLIRTLQQIATRHLGAVRLANGQDLARPSRIHSFPSLHSPNLAGGGMLPGYVPDLGQEPAKALAEPAAGPQSGTATPRQSGRPSISRPLIILCAPRSGSTLLFERLATCSPDWFTVGNESHIQIEGIPALKPEERGYVSNVLDASDATREIAVGLHARFLSSLRDRDGRRPPFGSDHLRLLEKTPKNALRVPFLRSVFPDARFLYLWREPEESLASMIEGWQSELFG